MDCPWAPYELCLCTHSRRGFFACRWLTATAPYAVDYADNFEPYIVANKAWLPKYDARFRG